MKAVLETLQPLGRALMLPIAVLPVAGLLLRLGQPDMLDVTLLSAAGDALFSHLGLLFAIGVATGYARDGNGAACLAGITCYLVATEAGKAVLTLPPDVGAGLTGDALSAVTAAARAKAIARIDVPIGIVSGLIGGNFYNRFSGMRLPEYLAFFGGRRFVPIVSGLAGLLIAMVVGFGFTGLSSAIDGLSRSIAGAGDLGLFIYGLLNRALLVTGLHHILNNLFWFVLGDYHGATGDLRRFFAGDPNAGEFMAGFFPVMMFGLPAACLAMYREALPERRKAVGGMLLSLALTSALTGVTEPIEFSFMFLAPVLYAIHAVLTGLSMVVMHVLDVKLGFSFSAGLIDYVINYGKATHPLLLFPVGAVYFLLYFGIFSFAIRRFDLKTPGREAELEARQGTAGPAGEGRGELFMLALGGAGNLAEVSACTTRLRLLVNDQAAVDETALKALGARGLIRPSDKALQVVLGPVADMVAVEIREAMQGAPAATAAKPAASAPAETRAPERPAERLKAALGGEDNVHGFSRHGNRLRVTVGGGQIDMAALQDCGVRAVARPGENLVHLLVAPDKVAQLVA